MLTVAALVPAASRPGMASFFERAADLATVAVRKETIAFAKPSGLVVGDPVLREAEESVVVVGRVVAVRAGTPEKVEILLDAFDARRLGGDAVFRAEHPGSNLGWALSTLATEEIRARVVRELIAAWDREGPGVLEFATPALKDGLGAVLAAAMVALPEAFAEEREAWDAVFRRLKADVFDARLDPVLNAELWPRIRAASVPAAAAMAEELVREIGLGSVMRAAWARTLDAVGVREQAFAAEVERLIEERAVPVMKRRAPDLIAGAVSGAREGWEQPSLRTAVAEAFDAVWEDAEGRKLVVRIIKRALFDDRRVRAAWNAFADDPGLREAVRRCVQAAEPIFEAALQDALLREDGQGLDRRLVRVLRNVLLWKDRRFLRLVERGSSLRSDASFRGVVAGE